MREASWQISEKKIPGKLSEEFLNTFSYKNYAKISNENCLGICEGITAEFFKTIYEDISGRALGEISEGFCKSLGNFWSIICENLTKQFLKKMWRSSRYKINLERIPGGIPWKWRDGFAEKKSERIPGKNQKEFIFKPLIEIARIFF